MAPLCANPCQTDERPLTRTRQSYCMALQIARHPNIVSSSNAEGVFMIFHIHGRAPASFASPGPPRCTSSIFSSPRSCHGQALPTHLQRPHLQCADCQGSCVPIEYGYCRERVSLRLQSVHGAWHCRLPDQHLRTAGQNCRDSGDLNINVGTNSSCQFGHRVLGS